MEKGVHKKGVHVNPLTPPPRGYGPEPRHVRGNAIDHAKSVVEISFKNLRLFIDDAWTSRTSRNNLLSETIS